MQKLILTISGLLLGGYMLFDGIYVLKYGKYFGPETPGPWIKIFKAFQINIYNLGPLFILFGVSWLAWLFCFWCHVRYTDRLTLLLVIGTLWYFPAGTILSLLIGFLYFF
ncbi:MAG: hypothetical protein HZA79_03170 [Sphingobacteriales bacterium]|nr:hypothetical protein [Sphingobacteriales bacterium]